MSDIACPRARTWMTPCIARDGSTALDDDGQCVGCGADPGDLLTDLAERYPPAKNLLHIRNPSVAADDLAASVKAYVER